MLSLVFIHREKLLSSVYPLLSQHATLSSTIVLYTYNIYGEYYCAAEAKLFGQLGQCNDARTLRDETLSQQISA